jgi:hypothetical protein
MTAANALVLAALVCYYVHSYWYNTMDFLYYRTCLAFPAANSFMKYLYANSFLLFVACVILFIIGVGVSITNSASATLAWSWIAVAVVLLLGAVRLLLMRSIRQWPRRAG